MKKEIKKVKKEIKKMSCEGRFAWEMMCLENALIQFNYSDELWNIVLAKMWERTYLPYIDIWETEIIYMMPFDDMEKTAYNDRGTYFPVMITEEFYYVLVELYKKTNKDVLIILQNIILTGRNYLDGLDESEVNPIIEVMQKYQIPFPRMEKIFSFFRTEIQPPRY